VVAPNYRGFTKQRVHEMGPTHSDGCPAGFGWSSWAGRGRLAQTLQNILKLKVSPKIHPRTLATALAIGTAADSENAHARALSRGLLCVGLPEEPVAAVAPVHPLASLFLCHREQLFVFDKLVSAMPSVSLIEGRRPARCSVHAETVSICLCLRYHIQCVCQSKKAHLVA
jgi:hypothetical protein